MSGIRSSRNLSCLEIGHRAAMSGVAAGNEDDEAKSLRAAKERKLFRKGPSTDRRWEAKAWCPLEKDTVTLVGLWLQPCRMKVQDPCNGKSLSSLPADRCTCSQSQEEDAAVGPFGRKSNKAVPSSW